MTEIERIIKEHECSWSECVDECYVEIAKAIEQCVNEQIKYYKDRELYLMGELAGLKKGIE